MNPAMNPAMTLVCGWFRELRSPETFRVDAGKGFNSAEFMKWSDRMLVLVKPAAGVDHTSNAADIGCSAKPWTST